MAKLDYDELFPGRFLKSGEFKGRDVTLTIADITTEDLPQDKGGVRTKGIIHFERTKKALVLNRTNGECIKLMFGRVVEDWIGKKVTLYPAPYTDSFTGEVGTAIRVRGSPDLPADKVVEVRLPRKKPFKVKLLRTGGKPARTEQPVEEPPIDELRDETPAEENVEQPPSPQAIDKDEAFARGEKVRPPYAKEATTKPEQQPVPAAVQKPEPPPEAKPAPAPKPEPTPAAPPTTTRRASKAPF